MTKPTDANPTDWQGPFNLGLCRAAHTEYRAQLAAHKKRGRRPSTFRYTVPAWQADAIDAMARNDEEAAKAAKLFR